ncbi:hypothetical protein F3K43_07705 [Streptomyces sp. LBUM 1476]|nr:hypothetical protein [Streptomyces sp. LBUM 1476]
MARCLPRRTCPGSVSAAPLAWREPWPADCADTARLGVPAQAAGWSATCPPWHRGTHLGASAQAAAPPPRCRRTCPEPAYSLRPRHTRRHGSGVPAPASAHLPQSRSRRLHTAPASPPAPPHPRHPSAVPDGLPHCVRSHIRALCGGRPKPPHPAPCRRRSRLPLR